MVLPPKNPKMFDPILVTQLKMRPHYSQSSRKNATPSNGTSPLAFYKDVPPGGNEWLILMHRSFFLAWIAVSSYAISGATKSCVFFLSFYVWKEVMG